jgi:hypothetical protein
MLAVIFAAKLIPNRSLMLDYFRLADDPTGTRDLTFSPSG